MTTVYQTYYQTEIGWLEVVSDVEAVLRVEFVASPGQNNPELPDILSACLQQLEQYFAGQRQTFSLKLAPAGTPFQRAVWARLAEIPFGATITYGQLAAQLGRPTAYRAVGNANGKNPMAIILPCHRVIGSDGGLTGYGGGLWRKQWLLAHEASVSNS